MDVCAALTSPPLLATLANDLERRRRTVPVHWVMDVYPELLAAFGVLKEKGLLYRLLARASRKTYRRAVRTVSLGETMTRKLRQAAAPAERIVVIENWVPGSWCLREILPLRQGRSGLCLPISDSSS